MKYFLVINTIPFYYITISMKIRFEKRKWWCCWIITVIRMRQLRHRPSLTFLLDLDRHIIISLFRIKCYEKNIWTDKAVSSNRSGDDRRGGSSCSGFLFIYFFFFFVCQVLFFFLYSRGSCWWAKLKALRLP